MHICIVQRIDLDFRSMRYIKIDIIIRSNTKSGKIYFHGSLFSLHNQVDTGFLVCVVQTKFRTNFQFQNNSYNMLI